MSHISAGLKTIDNIAGSIRMQYITSVPGQEATYILKDLEAQSYKAAGYPVNTTPYPFITFESSALGLTPQVLCDQILYEAAQWKQLAAIIEGKRRKWKKLISLSLTEEESASLLYQGVKDLEALQPQILEG